MSSLSNLVIADRFSAENPDWQSVIVTERLQLAADMMCADAKRLLDRARNGLGPRSPGSPLVPLAAHGSWTENRPKRGGPDGQSNCYPIDYPTSLSGLLSGLIFPQNA